MDYEIDPEIGLATSFRNGRRNGMWETNVTDSIIYQASVMHFPNCIGIDIPERLFTIPIRVKGTRHWYEMDLSYASGNWDEKYLAGEGWRDFLDEQSVAVGDVLDWYVEANPFVCTVSIRRIKKAKKGGKNCAKKNGGKDAKKKGGNDAKMGGSSMVGKKFGKNAGSSHANNVV